MIALLGAAALAGNVRMFAPVLAHTDCHTDPDAVFDAAQAHWRASGMPPGTVGIRATSFPGVGVCCGPDAVAIAVDASGQPLAELSLAGDCRVVRMYTPPTSRPEVWGEIRPVDPGPLPSMRAELALVVAWRALRPRNHGLFDYLVAVRTETPRGRGCTRTVERGWDVWWVDTSDRTRAVVRVDSAGTVVEVREEVGAWVLPPGAESARDLGGFVPDSWGSPR